jgi:hypothetical protein
VLVDKCVLGAERCVSHDLVENCDLFVVFDSELIVLVNDLEVAVVTLHSLIHLWQIQDVLGCVLDHISSQGSSFPEIVIVPHNLRYLLFLCVSHIYVVLKQLRQRDVIIVAINQLRGLLQGLLNYSVSDLSIKDKVAENVELISQR